MIPAQIIAFFASNPWRAACLVLASVMLGLTAWIFGLPLIGGGLLHQVSECRDGRKADRQSYEAAQASAALAAKTAREAEEARSRANAERIDHEHDTELADARDALSRYIATHRVRASAAGGASGSAGEAGQDRAAAVPEGSTSDAELVAASPSDLKICTDNSIYALKAFDFGQTLNAPAQ